MNFLRDLQRIVTQRQVTDSQGVITAYNRSGSMVGRYNPQSNRTVDRSGRVVGSGNQLSSLI